MTALAGSGLATELVAGAFPLGDGTVAVAEPHVKAALVRRGVSVPRGVTVDDPGHLGNAVAEADLQGSLVLKAYGPGLLHKSDVGAVMLDLDIAHLAAAAGAMAGRLSGLGIQPGGYLVEEMVTAGSVTGRSWSGGLGTGAIATGGLGTGAIATGGLGVDGAGGGGAVPDGAAAAPLVGREPSAGGTGMGGVEVIVGVVDRPPFGPVVALGLGGILTEVLDQVALRLAPLDEGDAVALVRSSPVAPFLAGVRGQPPVDQDALVGLLLALAGEDGLVAELGDQLSELECNPILASPRGVVALDARLVLRDAVVPPRPAAPATDFTRLFRPRAVAVAGASTSKAGFGNRALAAYRSMGWTDGLYAVHPTAEEVDGVPARPSVAELDDLVDYLLVTVPAARCPDVVRDTAGQVPFIHVVSGGFDEAGPDGVRLGEELWEAGREVGARIVGPNCIGIYCPSGRQTFQLDDPRDEGSIGIVSQSGGLAGDIIKAGRVRGLRFSKLATVGNALDVSPGELVAWLVDEPETEIVGIYLEGTAGADRLVDALRRARGRVPAALLLGGQSEQGGAAVASHTGSLAGDRRIWDVVAASTGASLVTTLEDLLAVLTYAQRWSRADQVEDDPGVLIVGVGGGASVLATDACDRAGLQVTAIDDEVQDELRSLGYGVGTSVANPLEIPFGPAAPVDALRRAMAPVQSHRPYPDVLVHVNVQAYYSYGTSGVSPLIAQLGDLSTALWRGSRLAVAVRNLECAPGSDADRLRQSAAELGLPLFSGFDEAATAIAAMKRFTAARQIRLVGVAS